MGQRCELWTFGLRRVAGWVGEFVVGELHAKQIASLSDGVFRRAPFGAAGGFGHRIVACPGARSEGQTRHQAGRPSSVQSGHRSRLFTPWIRQAICEERQIVLAIDGTESALLLPLTSALNSTRRPAECSRKRTRYSKIILCQIESSYVDKVEPPLFAIKRQHVSVVRPQCIIGTQISDISNVT